jgi:hypothetical protein
VAAAGLTDATANTGATNAAYGSVPAPPATPTLAGGETQLDVSFTCPATGGAAAVVGYTFKLTRVDTGSDTVVVDHVTSVTAVSVSGTTCSFSILKSSLPTADQNGDFKIALVRACVRMPAHHQQGCGDGAPAQRV